MFMVRFRALEEVASQGEQFLIIVNGPPAAGGSKPTRSASATAPGHGPIPDEAVRPGRPSAKRWCRGLYRGTVDFLRDPGPAVRIGRFSFRVR